MKEAKGGEEGRSRRGRRRKRMSRRGGRRKRRSRRGEEEEGE